MPRVRIRKTMKGTTPISTFEKAYKEVVENDESIRFAATMFDLSCVSLGRFIKKKKKAIEEGSTTPVTMGYRCARRVFDVNQERHMLKYVIKTADIFFGLPPKQIRKLGFQLAQKYALNMPVTWKINKMAGEDWYFGFMKRNPDVSIIAAQALNQSKSTSFNVTNVNLFFDSLSKLMDEHKFKPQDIYNMDETSVTTIRKPAKVVVLKGVKRVSTLPSAGKETFVTVGMAANACGNIVPPIFIFPRLRYQEYFIEDGPRGCIGACNESGWMEEKEFLLYLKHFKNHANPSIDHKVLLLLDNHPSHISIHCLDYCEENGIILLSFPRYCSCRLQPLERSVYSIFKKVANSTCDAWIKNNPRKTMKVCHIPGIVNSVLPLVGTRSNIISGFAQTGIFPLNRDVFSESDFDTKECVIYTDIPEGHTIQVEYEENPKKNGKRNAKRLEDKSNKKVKEPKIEIITDTEDEERFCLFFEDNSSNVKQPKIEKISDTEEDDRFCLFCLEPYTVSKSGVKWKQCDDCHYWSHEKCTQDLNCACQNCLSE